MILEKNAVNSKYMPMSFTLQVDRLHLIMRICKYSKSPFCFFILWNWKAFETLSNVNYGNMAQQHIIFQSNENAHMQGLLITRF